ncbi:MAG: exodeoxyribonuclease VII large subunit, partial [Desulfobacteraceae bacterium]|nr:exodeoxyribonuclease VII large subunit [Desulfobacteraceae bacterium]
MPLTQSDAPRQRPVYSVSELTQDIKRILEETYPFVWVAGELSNLRMPVSGHCYFTLKDDKSQISSVLFRNQRLKLRFQLEDGMSVTGFGRISVYEPRGTYQLIFEHLEPGGVGALQIAFEQLKRRLDEEGLFDAIHKKPLPFLPTAISVVTSPSGAVIHDILHVVRRRFANMPVRLVPVKVQGSGSESEIDSALQLLNQRMDTDVIILARGGGSLEDLQAFNSETVARSIFSSKIPIVSAVGHETDTTIADFVADLRAPTPSAAAELVVPSKEDIDAHLLQQRRRMRVLLERLLDARRVSLEAMARRLGDPTRRCQDLQMRVDDHCLRLVRSVQRLMQRGRERNYWLERRLLSNKPYIYIGKNKQKNEVWKERLAHSCHRRLEKQRFRLRELNTRLKALSPSVVLSRGYGIIRTVP